MGVDGEDDEEGREEELQDQEPAVPELGAGSLFGFGGVLRCDYVGMGGHLGVDCVARARSGAGVVLAVAMVLLGADSHGCGVASTSGAMRWIGWMIVFREARGHALRSSGVEADVFWNVFIIFAAFHNGQSDREQEDTGCSDNADHLLPQALLMPVVDGRKQRADQNTRWR